MATFDMYTIGICALVLIFGFAIFYFFFWSKPAGKESFPDVAPRSAPTPSGAPSAGGRAAEMVLFYGENCPHCHAIMPAWKEAKQMLAGKVNLVDLETKQPSYKNYEAVKGVPTIRLFPNGASDTKNFVEYEGDRSASSMAQFAISGH